MNRSQRFITLVIWLGTVLVALIAARSDLWFHGALAAVLTAAAAAASWRWGSSLRVFWGLAGLATALAGALIFLGAHRMEQRCTARYLDRRVVIGTELTPAGESLRQGRRAVGRTIASSSTPLGSRNWSGRANRFSAAGSGSSLSARSGSLSSACPSCVP